MIEVESTGDVREWACEDDAAEARASNPPVADVAAANRPLNVDDVDGRDEEKEGPATGGESSRWGTNA